VPTKIANVLRSTETLSVFTHHPEVDFVSEIIVAMQLQQHGHTLGRRRFREHRIEE
jgi:hypothetical protein